MEISKFSCRICLNGPSSKIGEGKFGVGLIETDEDNISYAEKFSNCTGIQIGATTACFAQYVCKRCVRCLRKVYNFLKVCKRTELILQNYVNREKAKDESKKKVKAEVSAEPEESDIEISYIDLPEEDAVLEVKSEIYPTQSTSSTRKVTTETSQYYVIDIEKENPVDADDFDAQSVGDPEYRPSPSSSDYEPEMEKVKKPKPIKKLSTYLTLKEKAEAMVNDYKMPKQETSLICDICGVQLKQPSILRTHMKRHNAKKDFKCEICGKEFLLQSYLSNHFRTHTGIKNFNCTADDCGRKFYSRAKLLEHERVRHCGVRKYSCKICDKKFSYSHGLKRHVFCHTGLKPFPCKYCNKLFRTKSNLTQHLGTDVHKDVIPHDKRKKHKSLSSSPTKIEKEINEIVEQDEVCEDVQEDQHQSSDIIAIARRYSIAYPNHKF